MNNTSSAFSFLTSVTKDVTPNQVNVLSLMMLKTPADFRDFIDTFEKRLSKTSDEAIKAKCNENIELAYNTLERMLKITQSVINLHEDEEVDTHIEEKEHIPADNADNTSTEKDETQQQSQQVIEKSAVMRIVRDDKELNELYGKFKTLRIEDINKLIKEQESLEKATEMATYLLCNGFYKANKPKKQSKDRVLKMVQDMWEKKTADSLASMDGNNTVSKEEQKRLDAIEKLEHEEMTNRIYSQLERRIGGGTEIKAINHEEAYKEYINKVGIDGLAIAVRHMAEEGLVSEAIEFGVWMLTKKRYIDAKPEENWDDVALDNFFTGAFDGLSSKVDIPEATIVEETKNAVAPASAESTTSKTEDSKQKGDTEHAGKAKNTVKYDVSFKDLYKLLDEESNKEGATVDSLKNFLKNYLSQNLEKKIERIDVEIANTDGGFEAAWDKEFNWVKAKLDSIAKKKAKEESKKIADSKKEEAIEKIATAQIKAHGEGVKSGEYGKKKLAGDLRKMLTKSNIELSVKEALHHAEVWFSKLVSDNKEATEPAKEENKEQPTIVDPVSSNNKESIPLTEESKDYKYLDEWVAFYQKYENTFRKVATAEVILKAFKDNKVFEKAGDETPLAWDEAQIESFFEKYNSTNKDTKPVDKVEPSKEEDNKKDADKAEQSAEDLAKKNNPLLFIERKDSIGFKKAIVELLSAEIASIVAETGKEATDRTVITKATSAVFILMKEALQDKKNSNSYCRKTYKGARDHELYNAINKIAIAAELKGFMKE